MNRGRAGGASVVRSGTDGIEADSDTVAQVARLSAAADSIGIAIDAATAETLLGYLGLLGRWNRVFNLTALRDPESIWGRHLLDCLAIMPALRRHAAGKALRVLDAGSGGGLPGVVIAAMQPDWQVVCVDAAAKKASFIRQVGLQFGMSNLQAVHARVESLPETIAPVDLVVSRAFASLRDFVTLTRRALEPGGVWAAMKARPDAGELSELPADVDVFHVEQVHVPGVDVVRSLVWVRQGAPSEQRYSAHGEDPLHR